MLFPTINDVRYTIARFTDKLDAPEEFDVRVNFAHRKNFAMQWDAKNFDALRLFKKASGWDTPPLYVTAGAKEGYADLPADYFAKDSATVFYGQDERDIEFLDSGEFDNRKRNYIEIPTPEYPIACEQGIRLRVLPKNIQYINLSYFSKPELVHFGYTTSRGFVEYDPATSVELPWDDEQIINIIMMVLQDLGLEVTPEQVKKAKK
jgi:hypothetical protein